MPISSTNSLLRPALLGIAAAAFAALGACGGGGGDGSGGNMQPPVTTGTVGVLLTDGPSDAFCQILATVESIDLLGASPTNVFTGSETVDVLDMRNHSDVFAIDTAVPIGRYDKIRLTLADLALVECDAAGVPELPALWEHPHLPGNGKLDLNPRGAFEVIGGETMIVELDLDMEKSLHLHQTGNGRWQFRPVVFVTITPDDSRLVRVFGAVRDLDGTHFELCPIAPVSSMDHHGGMGGDMSGDDDSGACIDVFTDGNTGIFDESGTRVGPDALANGDLLTAIGFLGRHDDDDDGDSHRDDLRLDAAVLELGALGAFERIPGTVVSAPPGNDGLFAFDPAAIAGATDTIDVLLQSGTRIFAIGSHEELTSAALQPGTTGEVDGVFDPLVTGQLKSSLVVLDQDSTPDRVLTDGTIASITNNGDADAATWRLAVDVTGGVTGQCVKTDAGTRYLLITESANAIETSEIGGADLAVGNSVDVYGSDDVEVGCILADTIQKYVNAAP